MPDDLASYFAPGGPDTGANLAKARAMSQILRMGLTAGAIGVALRTAAGVPNFIRRQTAAPPTIPRRQSQIRIPIPVIKESSWDEDAGIWLGNKARLFANQTTNKFKDWGVARTALMTHRPDGNLLNMPWALPTAAGAVGGGLYGGWKLTDALINRSKTREQEDELEAAKRRYENAMLMSYNKMASEAASEPTFNGLGELYEMTKQATIADKAKDFFNNPWVGGYGTLLGLGTLGSALTTGVLSYNAARGDAQEKALAEAVRRRQEMLATTNPMPIEAIPEPYYVPPRVRANVQKRLAALPTPPGYGKTANVGQAASQALGRLRANQAALWKQQQIQLGNNPDAVVGKGRAGGKPAPPQLPTMAGAWSRLASQPG